MDWVYYVLLLALLVTGLGITMMNLPGLWLMAAAAGLYALITQGRFLWPWGMVLIVVLCLVGEVLEFYGKAAGAGSAGGSKRAMLLAMVGGVAGGLLLSIPVPVLGTIVGVCLGAFGGAMLGQYTVKQDVAHSTLVGWGAAKGTLIGIVLKACVGVVIFLYAAVFAFPLMGDPKPAPQLPTPATQPTLPSSDATATAPTTLPESPPATVPATLPTVETP